MLVRLVKKKITSFSLSGWFNYRTFCAIFEVVNVPKLKYNFIANVLKLNQGGGEMYKEGFASKMKKARENTGFTQLEVEKETGIARSTIAKYETEKLEPDIEKLGILADFYGVSVDWLLGTRGGKEKI